MEFSIELLPSCSETDAQMRRAKLVAIRISEISSTLQLVCLQFHFITFISRIKGFKEFKIAGISAENYSIFVKFLSIYWQ